jgi:hypothetical protein
MDSEQKADASIGSLAFTLVLWLLAGYIFAGAFGFAYPANVAPTIMGGFAFTLMTGLLAHEVYQLIRKRSRGGDYRTEVAAVSWAVASMLLLLLLGFIVGMTIAMIALLRLYSRESWTTTIALTAGVMVTVYLAFSVGLGVPVFGGLLLGN